MFLDQMMNFVSRIDFMADYYQQDDNVDIYWWVVVKRWRLANDLFHQAIQKMIKSISLSDMIQSISPGINV